MSMNKVLVTGGAGFIGSELVRQLAQQAQQVVVVDNLVTGRAENLADCPPERVQLVTADIRDLNKMKPLLHRADVVFHLACLGVRHSIHSPRENHEVNATATLDLLSASRTAGVQRFVYVSSSEVYGTALRVPMSEEHPTFPMTVYGASKLAGECHTRAYHRTYGFPTVVVRPFNSYGPRCHHEGDSGEVIPKFLLRGLVRQPLVIFGDGTQTRDFTFVSDTARGIILAGVSDQTVGGTYNIGSGCEISIRDLADEVAQVIGWSRPVVQREPPRPGDVLRLFADCSKARAVLGFEPQVTLAEGLRRLKEWYLSLPETPQQLLERETIFNWKLDGKRNCA